MTNINTYPITERRRLDPAAKARWFRRQERQGNELLKPDAHQTLVYRVNGAYVLDEDRMRGADEQVVNATHVSVVDMRRNAPVVVRLEIPSADASYFEVLVTFVCTVTDAVAVVRGGINATESLWGHVKAHSRIFELGLDYPLPDVNEVRRVVGAQVKAYLTIKPPTVPGMTVSLASVEVSSPEFLAKYEAQHRDKEFGLRLARQEQDHLHELKAGQVLKDQSMESTYQEHQFRLADRTHSRDHVISAEDARHDRMLAAERSAFARSEFELNVEMIGQDPRRALLAAFADGKLDASALAAQLRELDDQDREVQVRQLQRERDERLQLSTSMQEERRFEQEQERATLDRERAEMQLQLAQEREDHWRRVENERTDRLQLMTALQEERRYEQEQTRAAAEREVADEQQRATQEREDHWRRVENERADRLQLMTSMQDDRRFEEEQQRAELERERAAQERERTEALRREAQEREDHWRRMENDREDRRYETVSEREDRQRADMNRRDDRLLADANRREDAQQLLRVRAELLKQATAQGHLNTVNLQADRLYAEVMGIPQPVASADAQQPLPSVNATVREVDADEDKAAQVREEDD